MRSAILSLFIACLCVSCGNKKAADHAREVMATYQHCVTTCTEDPGDENDPYVQCITEQTSIAANAQQIADCQGKAECLDQINKRISQTCKDKLHERQARMIHCITVCDTAAQLSMNQ